MTELTTVEKYDLVDKMGFVLVKQTARRFMVIHLTDRAVSWRSPIVSDDGETADLFYRNCEVVASSLTYQKAMDLLIRLTREYREHDKEKIK